MPANDKFRYNLKTMHIVFAVSCLFIFLATLAMMAKDHADDWRGYQITGFKLAAAMQSRDKDRITSGDFEARKAAMEAELKAAEEAVEAKRSSLDELESARSQQAFEVGKLASALKLGNAERDASNARRDLGISVGVDEQRLEALTAEFVKFKESRDGTESELQDAEAALDKTLAGIKDITKRRDDAKADLAKLNADLVRIQKTLDEIAPTGVSSLKRWSMQWPILDGFNSHMKVKQDWLPELEVTLGMSKIARFDRCRTCHINADVTAAGNVAAFPAGHPSTDDVNDWVKENKFPQPFSTHPNHELFVASSSPHPVAKFGCTICHDGQGSGTSFGNAEHTPDNPEQFEEWHKEYGYHPNHYWELPMQPKRFVESGCIKCHHQVTELGINPRFGASAPKVYRGFETMKNYGCFGCHEIHGFDGTDAIGPDLRLEPNFGSVASQMLSMLGDATGDDVDKARALLHQVHSDPLGASTPRNELKDMLMADAKAEAPVFPKSVSSLASAMKDTDGVAGRMRKVGPSFRRIKSKTMQGFIESWTENPQGFRPSTKMPRFYDLTNQQDEKAKAYETIELAGIAQYLFDKSVPLDALHPADGYEPDVDRGKRLFSERGCLACHSHKDFPASSADFGPELSRVYEKARRDEDNPDFSTWLYTWVKDPERYHERTRMPNLYLDVYQEGGQEVDPAADISAWLLSAGGPGDFPMADIKLNDEALESLVSELLVKTISKRATKDTMASRKYPAAADKIKGDEIELATADGSAVASDEEWHRRKLNYVGRKTISKYGCYGCHDVPGFETARPIGAALQDWGRKDTSKLALEHIEEWLHHHGEADGSSTHERVEDAVQKEASGDFTDTDEQRKEMSTAYFYQSLGSHGRAGFIWQKLRQPRSYDYEKTKTKGYDERLRMPKFPFDEDDIEAVATFVLGLVAEPPASEYVYKPTREENDRIEGEKLLAKYNCTGCHLIDMPEITFGAPEDLAGEARTMEDYVANGQAGAGDVHKEGLDLLMKLKAPRVPFTGSSLNLVVDGENATLPEFTFRGLLKALPDEEEDLVDQSYSFDLWETLDFGDSKYMLPQSSISFPVQHLSQIKPSRGGSYAEWLAWRMTQDGSGIGGNGTRAADANISKSRQMSPPPLYLEGHKVQTPWLYEFLLEPYKLRHETVLRMPRFNMSKSEAQTLANYFAAADGVPYPYQDMEPRDADYINSRTRELTEAGRMSAGEDYLRKSWGVLNGEGAKAQLCSKCHAVGGLKYVGSEKDPRGPNLQYAATRLRPDWLELWLYRPSWITPYTSMPVNFTSNGEVMPHLFKGHPSTQVTAVRDALLNYHRMMETTKGEVVASPSPADGNPAE